MPFPCHAAGCFPSTRSTRLYRPLLWLDRPVSLILGRLLPGNHPNSKIRSRRYKSHDRFVHHFTNLQSRCLHWHSDTHHNHVFACLSRCLHSCRRCLDPGWISSLFTFDFGMNVYISNQNGGKTVRESKIRG